jgi:hypothetical protein
MRLKPEDFAKVIDKVPSKVKVLMQKYPKELVLAGGFIRDLLVGDSPNDIDIFVNGNRGAAHAETLAKEFSELAGKPVQKSDCAFNVKDEYFTQFIHIVQWPDTFDTPYYTVCSFDFTMAQASMFFDQTNGWDSYVTEGFYEDIADRKLRYCYPVNIYGGKLSPLTRAFKFVARGWKIDNNEIAAIVSHYTNKDASAIKKDLESTYAEATTDATTPVPEPVDEWTPQAISLDLETTQYDPIAGTSWLRDAYLGSTSGRWQNFGAVRVVPSSPSDYDSGLTPVNNIEYDDPL